MVERVWDIGLEDCQQENSVLYHRQSRFCRQTIVFIVLCVCVFFVSNGAAGLRVQGAGYAAANGRYGMAANTIDGAPSYVRRANGGDVFTVVSR